MPAGELIRVSVFKTTQLSYFHYKQYRLHRLFNQNIHACFSIKENIVRNVMIPILSALFLFLSGILIINWQLWQMAKLSNSHTATASTQK
jgi:hypothetical protein